MEELTTTARFTEHLGDDESLTTIVARSVLEAALREGDVTQLWLEIGRGDDESMRISLDLSTSDLEDVLRLSGSDDVALTLDGDAVGGLFDVADVEGHGMKGTLAIAVTSAAILTPAGHGAGRESVAPAMTTQRAGVQATARRVASKPQVSTPLVVRASGLRVLRGGLDRDPRLARSART